MPEGVFFRTIPSRVYSTLLLARRAILQKISFSGLRLRTNLFPNSYHFLMTNYCNARCIFCDQKPADGSGKEITLEVFKRMISHIPTGSARTFFFSGGGEPLLCADLFGIIDYVGSNFPWIKTILVTNGILIEKYARELAQSSISGIHISIHGYDNESDYITQRIGSIKCVIGGIEELKQYLVLYKRTVSVRFFCVVSELNIRKIHNLIRIASELEVKSVGVYMCRYYAHKISDMLRVEHSLFYHQAIYNDIIRDAEKLARSLNMRFSHPPLFGEPFVKRMCLMPWSVMLVDWDGTVYPCCGGEVVFFDKVRSGEYYFGNLLEEHVGEFWNNETYISLRRTCSPLYATRSIHECENCHQSICLRGPDVVESHIINPPTPKQV